MQISPGLVYSLELLSVVINLISMGVYTNYYLPALLAELRLPEDDDRTKPH